MSDAFVAKLDGDGNMLWLRQFGTPAHDGSWSSAADAEGNVYVTGDTNGKLAGTSAGAYDAFLAKYDGSGALLWLRQLGTSASEAGRSVAVDGSGNT